MTIVVSSHYNCSDVCQSELCLTPQWRSFIQKAGWPYRTNLFLPKGTPWSVLARVSLCANPTELIKLLISVFLLTKPQTSQDTVHHPGHTHTHIYTEALTPTHIQSPAKPFLVKCVPGCLLQRTHTHTQRRKHARLQHRRSYLNWCECCHDIRPVLFVPHKPWRERAGSPYWLACKSIQRTRRHTHIQWDGHLIDPQISKKTERKTGKLPEIQAEREQ